MTMSAAGLSKTTSELFFLFRSACVRGCANSSCAVVRLSFGNGSVPFTNQVSIKSTGGKGSVAWFQRRERQKLKKYGSAGPKKKFPGLGFSLSGRELLSGFDCDTRYGASRGGCFCECVNVVEDKGVMARDDCPLKHLAEVQEAQK